MGARLVTATPAENDAGSATSLQDFSIIRSIGRGAFGKGVAANVIRELTLLSKISHPFIVNLWFTFQDRDYMYMVSDLFLGGDLRYHLQQQGKFAEDRAKLYMCEIALATEYLHVMRIIHRDIKPENILLDGQGHAHLTDLNLATQLEQNKLATSYSGTRPYMAPEIYATYLGAADGYDERVDWWALGVSFYEFLRGRTPFEFHSNTKPEQAYVVLRDSSVAYPAHWPNDLISFLQQILRTDVDSRTSCLDDIKKHPYTERIDFNWIVNRLAAPVFVPCKERLNCDPMYELEERILVSTPIHRRRNHNNGRNTPESQDSALREISQAFVDFERQNPCENGLISEIDQKGAAT